MAMCFIYAEGLAARVAELADGAVVSKAAKAEMRRMAGDIKKKQAACVDVYGG